MSRRKYSNTVILVIGPSGVGKSGYAEHAQSTIPGCRLYDLDRLVREQSGIPASELLPMIGNDAFLERCRGAVGSLMRSSVEGVSIVVVGAGALQSARAHAWISGHRGPTIAVVANPEEVYRRGGKRNENRTLDEFIAVEYSRYRRSLYDAAIHKCDVTGLSLDDARARFADLIRNITSSGRFTGTDPESHNEAG